MQEIPNTALPKSSYKSIQFTRRFETLVAARGHRQRLTSCPLPLKDVAVLCKKLREVIGDIADDEVVERILTHNPEVIRRVDRGTNAEPAFLAYLPLNTGGYHALTSGTFDRHCPDLRHVCKAGDPIVALYIWCAFAPGNFIPAITAIAEHFEEIAPEGVPIFTTAANTASARLFRSLGFGCARARFGQSDESLLVVFPHGTTAPRVAKSVTTTRVSRTIEDVMKVFSIRAATYMNEQACPYDEEFDGNDFCAAHILGEINGEPAGCIRVRFFGDFVKIERLAVRPEFRSSMLAFRLVRAALDYCRSKGFRKAYGHARHDLVNFWARFGFEAIPGRPTFTFSDVEYVEMHAPVLASNDVMTIGRSPFELIRPEGAWDQPGPLDRSATRGHTGERLVRHAHAG